MVTALGFVKGIAWEHESPFLEVDYEERNTFGVPPLKHLAMKKILSDQRNLDQEHFRHVPWPIAEELWQYLTRSGKRTLYMWKIFCTAYPVEFRRLPQHVDISIGYPQFPLHGYSDLINSPTCSWSTELSLWTESARVPELVRLSAMTNLVSLEVNTSTPAPDSDELKAQGLTTLSDRIVRTWSELAQTSEAFQHLRVLRLYQQRELTEQSFGYLSKLPSLDYCVMAMCDRLTNRDAIKIANSYGWVVCQEVPSERLCRFSPIFSSRASGSEIDWHTQRSDDIIPTSLPKDIPRLKFTLGQRRERLKDRDVKILCRQPDKSTALAKGKKRNMVDTLPSSRDVDTRKQARKPVMKQRGKDLSGMLAEFV